MARYGTTKYESNKQEKRVAKEVNGRTVVASGAIDIFKGDVRSDELLVECKTTQKNYYVLSYNTWEKIRHEAYSDGAREPVMCVDFENGKNRLAIIDERVWSNYVDWLPESHYIDWCWCTTVKSTKKISYVDDNTSLVLTFANKLTLSGSSPRKDVSLLLTPWSLFVLYLKQRNGGSNNG